MVTTVIKIEMDIPMMGARNIKRIIPAKKVGGYKEAPKAKMGISNVSSLGEYKQNY